MKDIIQMSRVVLSGWKNYGNFFCSLCLVCLQLAGNTFCKKALSKQFCSLTFTLTQYFSNKMNTEANIKLCFLTLPFNLLFFQS